MHADELREAVKGLMGHAKDDLAELVSFQSVADPKQYPPEECDKAAAWVVDAFSAVGMQDVKSSPTPDGSRCVHGHIPAPAGTPTVLLYCHYDVQPPLGADAWTVPVFELTERDGRWYGRGSADCKGNIVMHLTALRALKQVNGGFPCGDQADLRGLRGAGHRRARGVRARERRAAARGHDPRGRHRQLRGRRADADDDAARHDEHRRPARRAGQPDALGHVRRPGAGPGRRAHPAARVAARRGRATRRSTASRTTQAWSGVDYTAEQFRSDANVLDGAKLMGDGTVADMLWARPSATVLGIDVPPVVGSSAAIQASAAARISLRIPNGIIGQPAQDALVAHLERRVPWGLRCTIERVAVGDPFAGSLAGPGYESMKAAMEEAYGRAQTTEGQGGSIPLCNVLADTYPDAEIMLMGVEEPKCLIHAPNESVDPSEIENLALAEALFLEKYAQAR